MQAQARTNVFIVDDSEEVRRCLVDLIEEIEGVRVVGEAETPAAAVAGILGTRPDCVVLDFQLRSGTGLEVLRTVHPRAPQIAFIVLTNFANPQYERACMDAGARCFFDKSKEFARIRDVIAGLEPLPN